MNPLIAARLQMSLSLAFHIIFAAIGIGLPLLLVIVEGLYLRTGQPRYKALAKTWAKVTGLLFAVGAVSGTALSLELGLLWPKYMELLGPVVGHIFGLEAYAFFLEAIFIGLYLYGWEKIGPRAHWCCGVVIAVSGLLSGIFVLGVNAWMQQPVGFELHADRVVVTDPIAIFKQPLWLHMAWHSTLASYMAVAFAVSGWYAHRLLRSQEVAAARVSLVTAMAVGSVAALAQPLSGDYLAKHVFRTQPAKFAAMEGQFKTETHAPLRIGGWPDPDAEVTRFAIEIPSGLSFLATHDPAAEVPGLDQIPRRDWPNVELAHAAFQIMVGSGGALAALSIWFWLAYWGRKGKIVECRLLLRCLLLAAPLGFVGLEAGWFVSEVGRQPWVIMNILRTADAVTPAQGVEIIFFVFAVLYLVLGMTVILFLRKFAKQRSESIHG